MARPPIEDLVKAKVQAYIQEAISASPEIKPLSTLAVATAIGHDRRVLKKYGLDEIIVKAAKAQKKNKKAGTDGKRRTLEERIDALESDRDRLNRQANALLAQLVLTEGNAKRLGLDPEELYRPLLPPDRTVAKIYGLRKAGRR